MSVRHVCVICVSECALQSVACDDLPFALQAQLLFVIPDGSYVVQHRVAPDRIVNHLRDPHLQLSTLNKSLEWWRKGQF